MDKQFVWLTVGVLVVGAVVLGAVVQAGFWLLLQLFNNPVQAMALVVAGLALSALLPRLARKGTK